MVAFSHAKHPRPWCLPAAAAAILAWLLSLILTATLIDKLGPSKVATTLLWLGILPLHGVTLLVTIAALLIQQPPPQRLNAADLQAPPAPRQAFRHVLNWLPLVYLASGLVTVLTVALLNQLGIESKGAAVLTMLAQSDSLTFWLSATIVLVLVAPLAEEFLFRLVLFEAVFSLTGTAAAAAVLTSFAFASIHGILEQMPALFLLAMVLQHLRARWQSLWPAVAMHAAFNAVSLVMFVLLYRILNLPTGMQP